MNDQYMKITTSMSVWSIKSMHENATLDLNYFKSKFENVMFNLNNFATLDLNYSKSKFENVMFNLNNFHSPMPLENVKLLNVFPNKAKVTTHSRAVGIFRASCLA